MPRTILSLLAALAAVLAFAAPATALPPLDPDSGWMVDGEVRALARSGQTLYVGGEFTHLLRRTGGGLLLDANGQRVDGPEFAHGVKVVEPDGAGGFYVGGRFRSVDGEPRARLVHVLADGRLDAQFAPPELGGAVTNIAVGADRLFVSGGFDAAPQPDAVRNVVALDRTTGALDQQFVAGVLSNSPADLELSADGSTLFVVGDFTCAGRTGGTSACGDVPGEVVRSNAVAFATGDGAVGSWNPRPSQGPSALEISADGATAYLGGRFFCVGTPDVDCTDADPGQLTRRGIAAVDTAAGAATSFTFHTGIPGTVHGRVHDLELAGGQLTIAGFFTCVRWTGDGDCTDGAEATRSNLARVSTDGTLAAWAPAVEGYVADLALGSAGGPVWVGGDLFAPGEPDARVASVDPVSGALSPVAFQTDRQVDAVGVSGDRVFAGGDFSGVHAGARGNGAAFDLQTGEPTSWDPKVDDSVNAIAVDGGTVYLGGYFDEAGGSPRANLAAVDAATGAATNWNPGADDQVFDVLVHEGSVFAGGAFDAVGGDPNRAHLAKLDPVTGAPDASFPAPDDKVHALAVNGTALYVGGEFQGSASIGGQDREYAAAIDLPSGQVLPWAPIFNHYVHELAAVDGRVYAGGEFSHVNDVPRQSLAAVDTAGGAVLPWDARLETAQTVTGISTDAESVAIAGEFDSIAGFKQGGVALLDAVTGDRRDWRAGFPASAIDVEMAGGAVYAGGDFRSVGPRAQVGLATFTPPPVNLSAPSLRSTPVAGEGVECDPGRWEGNPVLASSWLLRGAAAGNGAAVFTPADGDAGALLACRVTARNIRGEATAESPAAEVARRPGSQQPPVTPAGAQRLRLTAVAGKGVRLAPNGRWVVRYGATLRVVGTLNAAGGAPVAGARVDLARTGARPAAFTTDARGRFTATIRRPKRALRIAAKAGDVQAALRADVIAALSVRTRLVQRGRRVSIAGSVTVPKVRGTAGVIEVRRGGRLVAKRTMARSGRFALRVRRVAGRGRYVVRFVPRRTTGLSVSFVRLKVKRLG
jgi:hypothetical protein